MSEFLSSRGPRLWALLLGLALSGCATPPAIEDSTLPHSPQAFKEALPEAGEGRWTLAAPAEAQPRGEWWKAFGDPVLDELAVRAAQGNNSVQIATARLAQARALLRGADAERAPQVDLAAGAVREALPRAGGVPSTLNSASINLSYELDLFGRLARAVDAAALDVDAQAALLQSTRLLVQADVAQTYLGLRAVDDERHIVRDMVAAYGDTLRLTERRLQAGDVAELEIERVRTELASTQAELLALDRQRALLEHALAVLAGDVASRFGIEAGEWRAELPVVPAGVPSTVLARRPDVAAAMNQLKAAQARVGVAQAAWFPSVVLTASGGYASSDLADLFKWSGRAWGIGALFALPLFDGGRREAGIQNAQAEFGAALAGYREKVLVAFRDVEDELASLRLLAEQSQAQTRAVDSAVRTTALSASRYRNGFISQLELLDAQRSELRNRRQAVQVQGARYQRSVGLIRALGGGWDAAPTSASGLAPRPGVARMAVAVR